ncbi:MAG: GDSL-type esterase/lipase family protein [Myxococcota bacterium]|nr:GDSL-type esterase/lipase family protein [Myxococcota bacterium]
MILRVTALCALVVLSQGCDRDADLEVEAPEPDRPVVQGQAHGLLLGAQFLPRTFARLGSLEDGGTGRFGVMQLGASHTEALHFSDEFSERLGARFGSLGPGYVPLISNRPHFVEPAAASERTRIRVTQQGWQFATALFADPGQPWGLNGTRALAQAGAVAVFQFEPETGAGDGGAEAADGGSGLPPKEEASLLDGGDATDAGTTARESLEVDPETARGAALVVATIDAGTTAITSREEPSVDAGSTASNSLESPPVDAGAESASLEGAPVDAGAMVSASPDGPPLDGGETASTALEGSPPVVAEIPGQLQLYYLDSFASARMKLVIDGTEHRLPAFGGTRGARIARYQLKSRPRRVEVHSPVAGATVYGLAYERSGAGIVYDVAGLSGSSVYVTDRYQVAAFSTQLRARKPSLFLLFYGTNESVMSNVTARDYRARYRSLLQKLRRAAPEAECLLISNTDREVPTDDGTWVGAPNATLVEETIQQVAADERCAFWSARAAMGGAGGMRAWLEKAPPLALADRTHLSELGYRELAAALVEDLLEAYREVRDARDVRVSNQD